jgi:hypothetical protein
VKAKGTSNLSSHQMIVFKITHLIVCLFVWSLRAAGKYSMAATITRKGCFILSFIRFLCSLYVRVGGK